MHKSRLCTIVIDCNTTDVDDAARFWSAALRRPARVLADPDDANYRSLEGPPEDVAILVQAVDHPSRAHIDIETNDIERKCDGSRHSARSGSRTSSAGGSWKLLPASGSV